MEYTYGINVANRYVLLLDEPEDIPKILKDEEKEKESKKSKTKKNLISEKENKGDGNQKEKGTQGSKKSGGSENRNAKIESGSDTQDTNKKGNNQRMQKGQQHVKFAAEVYEERNNARNFKEKPPYQRSSYNRDNGSSEASDQRDSGDDAPAEGSGNYTFRGRGRGRGGRGRGRGAGAGGGGFGRVFSRGGRGGFRRYGAEGNNNQQQQQPYDNNDSNQSGDFYSQEIQQPAGNDDSEVWDDVEEKPQPVIEEPIDWASDVPEAYTEPPKEEDTANQIQDPGTDDSGESSEPTRTLLTLDEYKALKGNREKPKYNLRRAGEGEDLSQWQNMHVLKNKLADVESEEEEEKYDPADYPQRVGRQKHILDINIQFKDAPRRGTRGRGRARGGRWAGSRGRGDGTRFDSSEGELQDQDSPYERGDRYDRPGSFSQHAKQHTVTICNENEFPSLA